MILEALATEVKIGNLPFIQSQFSDLVSPVARLLALSKSGPDSLQTSVIAVSNDVLPVIALAP